jgi:glycosyltransferase involved in cell wall biosynthesis
MIIKDKEKISPTVSVIINVYNGEKYIAATIESIFQQTFNDFELIVFNNCSTDNTVQILSAIQDPRLKIFETDQLKPLYAARNLAVDRTKGDYIAFCDSDDLWFPTKLEEQVSMLNKTGDLLGCTNFLTLNERADCQDFSWVFTRLPSKGNHDLIMNHPYIHMSSLMVDRRLFYEFKVYFNPKLTILGDLDFFIRALQYTNVNVIDNFLTVYRYHNENTGLLRFIELYAEGVKLVSSYRDGNVVKKSVLLKFEKRINWVFLRSEIEKKNYINIFKAIKSISFLNFLKLCILIVMPDKLRKKRSVSRGIL